jgi:hypothetical protein
MKAKRFISLIAGTVCCSALAIHFLVVAIARPIAHLIDLL